MIRKSIIVLMLIISTAVVYWQVSAHDFIYYDDQEYIFENRHVLDGLTMTGIKWALTSTYASNWHPLTWLSHMADRQFFGASPAGPHLMNLFFHILNSVLLLLLLYRVTGAFWQSAFVAALFALHPVHVESVAWAAERKDVLSALFFMLTILAYILYVERPGKARYTVSLGCFLLGLTAKPMLVTMPFVLLLIDYWPLKRFAFVRDGSKPQLQPVRRIVLEKAPFLFFAILSCVTTIIAQRHTMAPLSELSIALRLENAVIAYAGYLGKMIWPVDLAVFYPLIIHVDALKLVGALVLVATISVCAVRSSGKYPYLLAGWLWYVITLVPVIGIVQVGQQSMADRYTYIPLIGIFIVIAWGVSDFISRWPRIRTTAAVSALLLLTGLSGLTWAQVGYWKDTYTLFSHCVAVTENNYVALGVLGNSLVKLDRPAEALVFLQKSAELKSSDADVQHGLGMALLKLDREAEAEEHIRNGIKLNPQDARAYNDLGILVAGRSDPVGAIKLFREAVRLDPENADFRYELGVSLVDAGQFDEAIKQYSTVLNENPGYVKAHNNIGVALARQGKLNEAIGHFSKAVALDPANADALRNLELVRRMMK